ncbi:glycoside hydrolase [Arenibacter sp. N53]|uniref:glycoside hydrolase family 113 n=1 Tax=Arenibacter TaxID=178469 RepID=UPI000CD459D6|nr:MULTISPECIES: glycoside hydrolase TIM-barrel-like domain-containing protein [Arenibacter]MCM4150671.1 glycoside hydrolase [Arenibacter sp. N53]
MRNLGLLILFFLQLGCSGQAVEKFNGVSFVASRDKVSQEHVDAVRNVNAKCAAVMPFGFIRDKDSPEIIFDTSRQWFGETRTGARQYIDILHQNGLKVMLKPQIWISRGEFTGNLKMNSEENWQALEIAYANFIMAYATLAQETQADAFCIGTELEQFVNHRPAYWTGLIKKIRSVYKGKLTYAANWDEYGRTPFWDDLDFIGIDAYFPLSDEKTPTVEQLRRGWQPHKEKIKSLALMKNKPIIFTEYGYRSNNYAAKKPWLVDHSQDDVNLEAQANATKAIFEEFWKEEWFAGGFVWKWFIDHENAGGINDNRFTPQNKPAQEVIKSFYKIY